MDEVCFDYCDVALIIYEWNDFNRESLPERIRGSIYSSGC
jgi:hypothetical protein